MPKENNNIRFLEKSDEYLYISKEGMEEILKGKEIENSGKNIYWTTDYTIELPIRMKKKGYGSQTPVTIIQEFLRVSTQFPNSEALKVKRNKEWISWSFKEYFEDSCKFGEALIELGIKNNSAINIIGFNAPEWAIAFHGSLFGKFLPVGVYTTNNIDACKYIAQHSDAAVVIVENNTHLEKYLQIWEFLPLLKYIVIYNDRNIDLKHVKEEYRKRILQFTDLLRISEKNSRKNSKLLQERMLNQKPGNCCTLVYTSGTTGFPKGVMLSHDNYTWNAGYFINKFGLQETERVVSYLPLSHVASQIVDLIGGIMAKCTIYFADPSALQGTLIDSLKEARPTFFLGVPRVWEKIEEKMKIFASKNGIIKTKIANWAKSLGKDYTLLEIKEMPTSKSFKLAKFLIYNNIKKALGLDKARYFVTGAAPMSSLTRNYFFSLNIPIANAYGMSETAGVQTLTIPEFFPYYSENLLNSAGMNIEGTDIKILNPDQDEIGEICFTGRNRFMGYYKNEKATKESLDIEGFLHSGDLGKLDQWGNLYITGRIKELIITSGGENVAPILIENEIKEQLRFVSNVIVIGDRKKFLSALITLKYEEKDGKLLNCLTEEARIYLRNLNFNGKTFSEVSNNENVLKAVGLGIEKANKKAISNAQQIRKWRLIPGDFTVETGELTPTLKLKRNIVIKKFKDVIDSIYADAKL